MRESVGERIRNRRKQLGLSADYVAKAIGKDRSTYYRYESDDIENMPVSVLTPIAKVLRVSEAYLISGQNQANVKRIPILGHVAAGEPIYATEEYGEYVTMGPDVRVDFCLRVKGDSMIDAGINDGDLVFVRQQPTVENGEIAVVLIDDEVTLKRVFFTGDGIILQSENRKYKPMYISREEFRDIRILGKAVMLQSLL